MVIFSKRLRGHSLAWLLDHLESFVARVAARWLRALMAAVRKRQASNGTSGVGSAREAPKAHVAASLVQLFARPVKRPCTTDVVVLSDSDGEQDVGTSIPELAEASSDHVAVHDSLAMVSVATAPEDPEQQVHVLSGRGPEVLPTLQQETPPGVATDCCGSPQAVVVAALQQVSPHDDGDDCSIPSTATVVEDLFEKFRFGMPATPMQEPRFASALSATGRRTATRTAKRDRKTEEESEDFVSMSAEERARIMEKWRGLTGYATEADDVRLQMLIAAILHPKAPEAAVQSCMGRLRAWAAASGGPIVPSCLAASTPEDIEEMLQGLHWSKSKSVRVKAAAAMLLERWGGKVPCHRNELLMLPGIGPKLATLLEFVIGSL